MAGAIVLLSSGLDSTVAFKKAYDTIGKIICLTFDYGQRSAIREIENAAAICGIFGCEHHVIQLPWYKDFSSALTGLKKLPAPSMEDLDDPIVSHRTACTVWVPARNMVFLSIAAAFAEEHKFEQIVTGFNAEEAVTFPDNTPEFIEKFNRIMEYATMNHPTITAPVGNLDKEGIVRMGLKIQAPLQYSWSCYTEGPVPCGICESCIRRKRAFEMADIPDPILIR
jgi:7-cyano-7-deazaguanine synthase